MKIEEIKDLMQEMAKTGVAALSYEEGGVSLKLCTKDAPVCEVLPSSIQMQAAPQQAGAAVMQDAGALAAEGHADKAAEASAELPDNTAESSHAAENAEAAGELIKSPLVGTFYTAPSPDKPVFVKVGDSVKKGQVLGLIEAMKLMNEVEAEKAGTITEILVENEQMVEYGQPLFRIV